MYMSLDRKGSKLEDLQESLYDPHHPPSQSTRRMIHQKEFDVRDNWSVDSENQTDESQVGEEADHTTSKLPFFFLSISLILCVVAAVFAFYRLSGTYSNSVEDLIVLQTEAPEFIDGGVPFDYVVTLGNQSTSNLELVDIEVSYPQGVSDTEAARVISLKDVGTVIPNTILEEKFPITLFGIPGTTKPITTILRYSVPGSTATFEKKETKIVEIKTSPLSLSIDALQAVTAGQEMAVKITIESTKGQTIPSALLKLTYPTGFEFVRSDITPTTGNNVWDIGTLAPGVVKEITVFGIPRGEDEESRSIRVEVGTKDASGVNIAALFAESKAEYLITKPFLQTDILVSNIKSPTHIVSSNSDVTITIAYKNNIDKKLQNAEIALLLEGLAIDEATIRTDDGYYDSRTNIVTWTKSGVRELGTLEPGATGRVAISFKTRSSSSLEGNEQIKLEVSSKARRIGESGIAEFVQGSQSSVLRVLTRIALTAETALSAGGFTVSGPIPPKAEQETSYVLVSQIKNTVNPVDKAEVKFKLPFNVRFIAGNASQGSVRYSEFDREVVWAVGSVVKSGTGSDPVLYVHVAVLPSLVDVGKSVSLATEFMLTATDVFTKTRLEAKGPSVLTTKFRAGDGFKKNDDIVNK